MLKYPHRVTIPHSGLGTEKIRSLIASQVKGHHPTRWARKLAKEVKRKSGKSVTIPHSGLRTEIIRKKTERETEVTIPHGGLRTQ